MKTLYISDLDGTLLNDNAKLTEKTVETLNYLIDNSILFTLATARTYSTVVPMMKNLKLNIPVVLMNGVCIYDINKLKPVKYHHIDYSAAVSIVDVFNAFNKTPMLYYNNEGSLTVEYIKLTTNAQKKYVSNRKEMYNKQFVQVEKYSLNPKSDLVYIAILDKKDELQPIFDVVSERNDVTCNFYTDNYSGDYFLEIYSKNASKAKSALEVKKIIGADRIIAFGDNLNDIPLFEIADEAYAVENACDELKSYATGIINNNNDDAVANYILKRFIDGD